MKPLTVMPRRAVTPLKQATPSRSPTATPPALQQVVTNATQPSLVGMSKEEKAAEMNRRKEERKQVSRAEFTELVPRPTTLSQRIAQLKAQKASGGKV